MCGFLPFFSKRWPDCSLGILEGFRSILLQMSQGSSFLRFVRVCWVQCTSLCSLYRLWCHLCCICSCSFWLFCLQKLIVSLYQLWFKAKLIPPECLVSKADFFFSSGEQESTWLQWWHSFGVPEQLPPKSSGKQLPWCLPGLDGPTYVASQPPFDLHW